MANIILVRHGQTDWSKEERFRGRAELALNETGIKQAKAVAKRLSGEKISTIYSSPLKRAVDTAQYIAKLQGINLFLNEALIDIDYGQWEGFTPEEVSERFPQQYQVWIKNPQEAKIPQGETLKEVEKRAKRFVEKLPHAHPNSVTVLVSHKVVNKVLICSLLDISLSHFWQIKQSNGGLSQLYYNNGLFSLSFLNNTCHLRSTLRKNER